MDVIYQAILNFGMFFWQVFAFWACWQVCDYVLNILKIKLRKPWIFESKNSATDGLHPDDDAVE